MIQNIKTINGFLYLLYQADNWQTKKEFVLFGIFDSYEHAHFAAIKQGLYDDTNLQVIIKMAKINKYGEVV